MAAPTKLAHVVFRTNQLERMIDWYCAVLEAHRVFTDPAYAFITYDDEHHRVAFVAAETYAEKPAKPQVGFYHVAFTYGNLGELLSTYERLRDRGIKPWRPILHGPTASFYYKDPDNNDVELQVDVYPDAASATQMMQGAAFASDPVGKIFDPEQMIARHRAGVPDFELMRRPDA
jgi:catechol-2,3-dioxygenase